MTYKTVNRAIEAARTSNDPLIRATGRMLEETWSHLSHQADRIQGGWRMEAMRLARADGHKSWTEEEEEAVSRHYARIEKERGPVSCARLPFGDSETLGRSPMMRVVEVARALLTRLGEDQGVEVWPGQYAGWSRHGRVKVVGISLDGKTYEVRQVGMYTYPDDPTSTVPASEILAETARA